MDARSMMLKMVFLSFFFLVGREEWGVFNLLPLSYTLVYFGNLVIAAREAKVQLES